MDSLTGKMVSAKRRKEGKGQTKSIATVSNFKESIAPETEWRIDTEGEEKFKEKLESPYNVDV